MNRPAYAWRERDEEPQRLAPLSAPKISCLCVTYNRPEFTPFLLWNYAKQTHADRELIVIDGSDADRGADYAGSGARYFHHPGLANIPRKRNLALAAASGDIVTWFDDDDWQHPRKCEILCGLLKDGLPYAGCLHSLFYNVYAGISTPYRGSAKLLFNSVGVRREAAKAAAFDESQVKASDTRWMKLIQKGNPPQGAVHEEHPLFFWLSHHKNISNPVSLHRYSPGAQARELEGLLGSERGEFEEHVRRLRSRETGSERPREHANRGLIRAPVAAAGKKRRVLVGINSWNLFEEAKQAYESFVEAAANDREGADFLVVDDCSDDPRIEEYFLPLARSGALHYVRNAEQKRLTRSWNILLHYAVERDYDHVIQSNHDVRFPAGWLGRFVAHLDRGAQLLVPLTDAPGRFSSDRTHHVQDIRRWLPRWKPGPSWREDAERIMRAIAGFTESVPVDAANGFFIGFRCDFLKRIHLGGGRYWNEEEKYLRANGGVGGDESEIRKRTGAQTWLAKDVFIHHTRQTSQIGLSRAEFLRRASRPSESR